MYWVGTYCCIDWASECVEPSLGDERLKACMGAAACFGRIGKAVGCIVVWMGQFVCVIITVRHSMVMAAGHSVAWLDGSLPIALVE